MTTQRRFMNHQIDVSHFHLGTFTPQDVEQRLRDEFDRDAAEKHLTLSNVQVSWFSEHRDGDRLTLKPWTPGEPTGSTPVVTCRITGDAR